MAKKITLTVNENLFRKIDEWRSSFNLSALFQDAVSEAIKTKEEFRRLLSGKDELPQIIERLKAEKRRSLEKARQSGAVSGGAWAGRAHYEDLTAAVAAIAAVAAADRAGGSAGGGAKGAGLSDLAASLPIGAASSPEDAALEAWERELAPALANDPERAAVRAAFRRGWREGVAGLWNLVKDKLDE
jgi:hypothetical protein